MTTTTTGAAPGAPGAAAAPARARGGLRTALRITALELRLLTREPVALVGLIAFPAVTVLILGGVFGSVPDPEFGGIRPDEHYVVGYIGVVLAQLGLVTLPAHIASHRESGVLRRYRAAGVGAGTMVASEAAVGIILGLGGALIVLVVGGAVYGVPAPDDPLRVAGWLLAGLACFVAAGLALGTLMPSSRAANAIGNFVFIPMFLLGGGGPPRDVMTGPMQAISDALPLSHVIGGLRLSWLGATDDPHALWYPAALAAAAVLLAVVVTRRRAT
jgi:ABC-2 type transport system permease protein